MADVGPITPDQLDEFSY